MADFDLLKQISEEIRKSKCEDIVILDVKEECNFTDFFLICSGLASTHVEMVTKDIVKWLKSNRVKIKGFNKNTGSIWSLIDCGFVVIHIFSPEARKVYNLDSLWNSAKLLQL